MSSMSTALSAVRAAGRQHLSASKGVLRKATGSHVFQIDTYEQVTRMMAKGDKMRSRTFTVGGHDWRVVCYPKGFGGHDGFLSIYLDHASHAKTGEAMAKFGISILDKACWKPSYSHVSEEQRCFSDTPSTSLTWGWRDFIKHEDLDKEKHIKDDCLTVVCDVTVTGLHVDDHAEVAEPEPALVVPASPPFDLHGPLGEVIWNKQKPDVKIEAGGKTFAVHRWVLEARSPVFKEDLSLASAAAGEGTAELRIDDMDADVCKALLQFIYTDRLLGTDSLETTAVAERLLIAADRYKLEKLTQICEKALLPSISLSSVAATLALSERHHCPELREACMRFLSSDDNLKALVDTDGFEQMKKYCSSALLELLVKQHVGNK